MHRYAARLIVLLCFVLLSANEARACQVLGYVYVYAVSDTTGEFIGGHWQLGWVDVPCDWGGSGGGGGGYYEPYVPPSGGGSTPTVPEDLTAQRQLYKDAGCPEPDVSAFLDRDGYAATGMGTWFPWEEFKITGQPYVLVSDALANGTREMGTCMDNSLGRLAEWGSGAGYRLPAQNTLTPCGHHTKGNAIDLSIRAIDQYGNNTGAHDCRIWNALAACAHAAGGYVETWADIKAQGVPHFHVSFGQPPNPPEDYGDACANP